MRSPRDDLGVVGSEVSGSISLEVDSDLLFRGLGYLGGGHIC
jgi:hypothetical protein